MAARFPGNWSTTWTHRARQLKGLLVGKKTSLVPANRQQLSRYASEWLGSSHYDIGRNSR